MIHRAVYATNQIQWRLKLSNVVGVIGGYILHVLELQIALRVLEKATDARCVSDEIPMQRHLLNRPHRRLPAKERLDCSWIAALFLLPNAAFPS